MNPIFRHPETGSPVQATSTGPPADIPASEALPRRYREIRRRSEDIVEPLEVEDLVVQTMPDVSPTKWHLAHTSWFFETFLLSPHLRGYEPLDPRYRDLFNSYYNAIGSQYFRPHRGFLARPTVRRIVAYREHVDAAMQRLFEGAADAHWKTIAPLLEIGLNHEEQHQELMLTDLKHVFATNPLLPVYRTEKRPGPGRVPATAWTELPEAIREIGWAGPGFSFDNETPRHRELVPAFAIHSRLVTNGEFLDFVEDGGYRRPEHWLSDGWSMVQAEAWQAPLYWRREDGPGEGRWLQMTLAGERALRPDEPVCHVSFYEADAYARWAGARLPSEAEWETVAARARVAGNLFESGHFHPAPLGGADAVVGASIVSESTPAPPNGAQGRRSNGGDAAAPRAAAPVTAAGSGPAQLFGDVWEWTRTPYDSYPGYRPPEGALGEYNSKFMCNQMVLRGGSCVTPVDHVRSTYRNFFPPHARWQFSGFRLAKDAGGPA